jgi:hypothetical protein
VLFFGGDSSDLRALPARVDHRMPVLCKKRQGSGNRLEPAQTGPADT